MTPRTLILHADRRLERLCSNVIHMREAYRRRPDPKTLAPIARDAGIPAGTFHEEMRRLRYDPGPDGQWGVILSGDDMTFTPFTVHVSRVGDIIVERGCPMPGDAHWDWGILDLSDMTSPRLALY